MSPPVNTKQDESTPTLAQIIEKAIDLLKGNENGFFLQGEGSPIGKQEHAANPCGQSGETVDLDEAVQSVLEFARKEGNTLVVVTADHADTRQIVAPETKAPGLTQARNTKMVLSWLSARVTQRVNLRSIRVLNCALQFMIHMLLMSLALTEQKNLFFTIKSALK